MESGTKGQPTQNHSRLHRKLWKDGTAFGVDPVVIDVSVSGDNSVRLYFKATQAGTLGFAFLRPDLDSAYDTPALIDSPAATLANTEAVIDIPVQGEGKLRITFTPALAGVFTYADIAHLFGV